MSNHIVSNQVTCSICEDTIFSAHRHDYVTCSCGNVSVNGGNDYLQRIWKGDYIEQSIILPRDDFKTILAGTELATSTGRNNLGITYAVLRAIRDAGYELKKISDGKTLQ